MPERRLHFHFGNFELDCASGELRKHGVRLKLEDQPFRLLVELLKRQGEVLTREELKKALWSNDTYVDFNRSLTRVMNKVRIALGDSAENPRFIETLPRRGYRFVAPVSVDDRFDEVNVTEPPADRPALNGPPSSEDNVVRTETNRRWAFAALTVAGAITLMPWLVPRSASRYAISTIAVLPLHNVSGSSDGDYFGDAMTDQLITSLSHIQSLKVVSQKSVLQYKQTRKKLNEIARELDVDGLLEASQLSSNGRVRINARLILFPSEHTVWTKTYEREAVDNLALQSALARSIADEIQDLISAKGNKRFVSPARTNNP